MFSNGYSLEATQAAFDKAALNPEAWSESLDFVGRALGSKMFALLRVTDRFDMFTPEHGEEHLDTYYRGQWAPHDLRGNRIKTAPRFTVITDDHLVSQREREDSEFYRGFAYDLDVPYVAGWRFEHNSADYFFASMRSRAAGRASVADIAALNAIRERAVAAVILSSAIEGAYERGLIEGLSAAGVAAIAVGRGGFVIGVTPQAERLFSPSLTVTANRLTSSNSRILASISALVAALRHPRNEIATQGVLVPHPLYPRGLMALPIISRGSALDVFRNVRAIVILKDLTAPIRPDLGLLRALYGLTLAEAEVAAAVAGGETLEVISNARQVSLATTRSMLKSVFSKTKTHRQAELVALLGRL